MVIFKTVYYITVLTTLSTILVYFSIVNVHITQTFEKDKGYRGGVKEVVAYSLLKRIEIESEELACEGQLKLGDFSGPGGYNEGSNVGRDEDTAWSNIRGTNFYVSSVNLDRRLDPYHYVRIIGMVKGQWNQTIYCQFQTSQSNYNATKSTVSPIWSQTWDGNDTRVYFNPVLLSCRIPIHVVPTHVGLSTKPCGKPKGNQFKLSTTKTKIKNTFTICVKPLDFLEDVSKRLTQWIEIIRILGADKVEISVRKVKKNVWRLLKWYNSNNKKQIIMRRFKPISKSFEYTAEETINSTSTDVEDFSYYIWQKRRYEVVAYNNCFYRNIETSHFVIPLDIDEIIVPKKYFTWKKLFGDLFSSQPELKSNFASFTVPNTYFFGRMNLVGKNDFFFFRNYNRSHLSPAGESGKSFISTKNALSVFNHYALEVLRPGISKVYFLSPRTVQLNHYKEKCDAVILPQCVKYFSSPRITDTVIFKYKRLFYKKYNNTVAQLQNLGIL